MIFRTCATVLVLLSVLPASPAVSSKPTPHGPDRLPRTLTFEDRVAAQRAIEEVYWRHRIWPQENPNPKPPLDAVMPDGVIRARVEDYLRMSNALETWWDHPIAAVELQAELDRMARHTRAPEILQELFDALGNDAWLIAETVARPTLVERLIRHRYASEERFHGKLRRRAEEARASCDDVACMRKLGGEYHKNSVRLDDGPTRPRGVPHDSALSLSSEEWRIHLERLAVHLDATPESIPTNRISRLMETPDGFVVIAVLAQRDGEIVTATTTWPKQPFDTWWKTERAMLDVEIDDRSTSFTLPEIVLTDCTGDTWKPTHHEFPDIRFEHTAVWTGTEMIVWGGYAGYPYLNTGGRYNPTTDIWTATSIGPRVPSGRHGHTAVWTGTEMIVWGGVHDGADIFVVNTGGRYAPTTDRWVPTSTGANVPDGRIYHTAVWTGTEMIVWGGGGDAGRVNTGGRYAPTTDRWVPTSTGTNVPDGRSYHTAVWTGAEMIVWGGFDPLGNANTGGRYDPTSDRWTPTSTGADLPEERYSHTAVWTGTEMIIWGGYGDGPSSALNTGGRYNPTTDRWAPTSTGANLPIGRDRHTAVWTGTEMIVWGGTYYDDGLWHYENTGGRYDPTEDRWTATSTGANVPSGREWHTAVWTGTEMIVWGGIDLSPTYPISGGRYNPATDRWTPTSTGANVPAARSDHTAVWTGTEMIVWGGWDARLLLNSGGRYNPATDSWTPTSMGASVPDARAGPTSVWTGSEMIVWGGGAGFTNTGGRYSPTTDTWTPTSTGPNVPTPRAGHTAVWTGTEMIVWGGSYYASSATYFDSGGRYDPTTDSWAPTSLANAPEGRSGHTQVWTGNEMIVWGGSYYAPSATYFDSGGRYDPTADSWTPTSLANAPAGRAGHTLVWTGTEMIVWGGRHDGTLNDGYRYDPTTDNWAPTSTGANVPTPRSRHTAVWTGAEMIVWGGASRTRLSTGGRYNPTTDGWTETSTGTFVPNGRQLHTAVWTGTEMIVWGGDIPTSTGGLYCGCPEGQLVYRDADGDGYGDAARTSASCDGSIPEGYIIDYADCDDSDASIYPGAREICNGIDDDCNGVIDDSEEADLDGDGLCCDGSDACCSSDLRPEVVVGSCDSGVANTFFPDGCTISDHVAACQSEAGNHGSFVSCVARLTNDLRADGVITGRQQSRIQRCAARADPRPPGAGPSKGKKGP